MVIGFRLSYSDNDSFMIDEKSLQNNNDYEVCIDCNYIQNFDFFDLNATIKKKYFDFSCTYENVRIVSEKFVNSFPVAIYPNIEYIKLNKYDNLYFIKIKENYLKFDYLKRETRFINKCTTCNNYEAIIGSTPVFLSNINSKLEKGFYQTDLLFGSGNSKKRSIIIDIETGLEIKKNKFKGLTLIEINI